MSTRMRMYAVSIVQVKGDEIYNTHVKSAGRSQYEAIGYVLDHHVMLNQGKIVSVNAVSCWDKPATGDNTESLKNSY